MLEEIPAAAMEAPAWARGMVAVAAAYAAIGLVFAVAFAAKGVRIVDPVADESTFGFRMLLLPGAALLWPWLLRRWIAAQRHGAEVAGERTPEWSPRIAQGRRRALVGWIVLAPLAIAILALAMAVRRSEPSASPDAADLPAQGSAAEASR